LQYHEFIKGQMIITHLVGHKSARLVDPQFVVRQATTSSDTFGIREPNTLNEQGECDSRKRKFHDGGVHFGNPAKL
jgi:hypothetical protein